MPKYIKKIKKQIKNGDDSVISIFYLPLRTLIFTFFTISKKQDKYYRADSH